MRITKTDDGYDATDHYCFANPPRPGEGETIPIGLVTLRFDLNGNYPADDPTWTGPTPDPTELHELIGEAMWEVRAEITSEGIARAESMIDGYRERSW
jgi:hypothetical protein